MSSYSNTVTLTLVSLFGLLLVLTSVSCIFCSSLHNIWCWRRSRKLLGNKTKNYVFSPCDTPSTLSRQVADVPGWPGARPRPPGLRGPGLHSLMRHIPARPRVSRLSGDHVSNSGASFKCWGQLTRIHFQVILAPLDNDLSNMKSKKLSLFAQKNIHMRLPAL